MLGYTLGRRAESPHLAFPVTADAFQRPVAAATGSPEALDFNPRTNSTFSKLDFLAAWADQPAADQMPTVR